MSKLFNRKKEALKNGDANENNYQREISQIKLFWTEGCLAAAYRAWPYAWRDELNRILLSGRTYKDMHSFVFACLRLFEWDFE